MVATTECGHTLLHNNKTPVDGKLLCLLQIASTGFDFSILVQDAAVTVLLCSQNNSSITLHADLLIHPSIL
jgi:hypothetical protein